MIFLMWRLYIAYNSVKRQGYKMVNSKQIREKISLAMNPYFGILAQDFYKSSIYFSFAIELSMLWMTFFV